MSDSARHRSVGPLEVDLPAGQSSLYRALQSALPKPATYLLLGLGIMLLDFLTGPFLLLFMLYVLPVGLAAWFTKGRLAYALALLFPIGSLLIEIGLEHLVPVHYVVLNAMIQIGVLAFLVIACRTARQNIELKRRVKLLETILPVCMGCRRIRDEQQNWQPLEVYVTEHTDSVVSHGVCPDCAKRLYGADFGSDA